MTIGTRPTTTTTTTSVWRPFSRTTWVSRHQKGKPFWIVLEQEMMWWQWHQLDHMQIICTSLQTDNHASTSPRNILFNSPPTNSRYIHQIHMVGYGTASALKALNKTWIWCCCSTHTIAVFVRTWRDDCDRPGQLNSIIKYHCKVLTAL